MSSPQKGRDRDPAAVARAWPSCCRILTVAYPYFFTDRSHTEPTRFCALQRVAAEECRGSAIWRINCAYRMCDVSRQWRHSVCRPFPPSDLSPSTAQLGPPYPAGACDPASPFMIAITSTVLYWAAPYGHGSCAFRILSYAVTLASLCARSARTEPGPSYCGVLPGFALISHGLAMWNHGVGLANGHREFLDEPTVASKANWLWQTLRHHQPPSINHPI